MSTADSQAQATILRGPAPGAGPRRTVLPRPRGPWSERLIGALRGRPGRHLDAPTITEDPIDSEDLQLALYLCYELHYTSIEGVDSSWEWDPTLMDFRARLEGPFEDAIRALAPPSPDDQDRLTGEALHAIVAADDGPPLSRYLETQGTEAQVKEFLVHRSAYQLKEADPHSWAVPRLSGAPKAAMLEVQYDEYGAGDPERIHAVLFANTMVAVGLDAGYGAYLDRLPGVTLATVNLMSMFGLHRRLRGATVGHLAAFEMTSSLPNRRYGNALRRLGYNAAATDFFDEHVTADAIHENIAAWDMAGGLADLEPTLAPDILFGARALLALEARWADRLLSAWDAGSTSLRAPLATT